MLTSPKRQYAVSLILVVCLSDAQLNLVAMGALMIRCRSMINCLSMFVAQIVSTTSLPLDPMRCELPVQDSTMAGASKSWSVQPRVN